MRNAGRVVSKTMILSHVWGYDFDPGSNVVDVLVFRLRDKIDRGFDSAAAAHGRAVSGMSSRWRERLTRTFGVAPRALVLRALPGERRGGARARLRAARRLAAHARPRGRRVHARALRRRVRAARPRRTQRRDHRRPRYRPLRAAVRARPDAGGGGAAFFSMPVGWSAFDRRAARGAAVPRAAGMGRDRRRRQ